MGTAVKYKILDVRELSDKFVLIVNEEKTAKRTRLVFLKSRLNKNTELVTIVVPGDTITYKREAADVGYTEYLKITAYKK